MRPTVDDPVAQACIEMGVEDRARALLAPGLSAQEAVQVLLDAHQVQAALQLLARLLPKRYVVAWLCQCARGEALGDDDRAGAALAEQWVRDPIEHNRRIAYEFASADGYCTLGGWLAAAAGWSGGSLAPAAQETPVPPPPFLTARAATAAVNLLAAIEPDRLDTRRIAFAQRALVLLADHAGASAPRTDSTRTPT
ncbi:hypothetical protein H0E82_16280 [Luteimonas sp. SJ-16]|uniref:Uncharacterized protein n=2 Tax=Luteimonas deserti TaxID=2752306 RepID=A0A7Z0TVW4_9GAMM|nr:hypothetical protein [Luteimonas deserti]NYZ64296.1 hypothetical protein [Luteimonas deserti]